MRRRSLRPSRALLIGLWLRTNADDYSDVPSPGDVGWPTGGGGPAEIRVPSIHPGGGGDFSGGGASASFDAGAADGSVVHGLLDTGMEAGLDGGGSALSKAAGEAEGSAFDADEFVVPLVAIVLVVGLAFASLYIVYIAPALMAELMVDAALSYALMRRLRGDDPSHWLLTAFRRTVWPFVATGLFLAAVGAGLSAYAPGARSLGEAVRHEARIGVGH